MTESLWFDTRLDNPPVANILLSSGYCMEASFFNQLGPEAVVKKRTECGRGSFSGVRQPPPKAGPSHELDPSDACRSSQGSEEEM